MNNNSVTFSLISVKDGNFKARYEAFTESTGDNRVSTYENTAPVHNDLIEPLQRLVYHLVHFMEMAADSDSLHITGFQRQNSGNAQLLTIYARMEDHRHDLCGNIVSRFYIGRDEYPSIDLLLEDLSACEREALAYIENGKRLEHDTFIRLDENDLSILHSAA